MSADMVISALFGAGIEAADSRLDTLMKEEEDARKASIMELEAKYRKESADYSSDLRMEEEEHRQGLISDREKDKEKRDIIGYDKSGKPVSRSEHKDGMELYAKPLGREKAKAGPHSDWGKIYADQIAAGKSPEEARKAADNKLEHDSSFKPDKEKKVNVEKIQLGIAKARKAMADIKSSGSVSPELAEAMKDSPTLAAIMGGKGESMSEEDKKSVLAEYQKYIDMQTKKLNANSSGILNEAVKEGESQAEGNRAQTEASKDPGSFINKVLANKGK